MAFKIGSLSALVSTEGKSEASNKLESVFGTSTKQILFQPPQDKSKLKTGTGEKRKATAGTSGFPHPKRKTDFKNENDSPVKSGKSRPVERNEDEEKRTVFIGNVPSNIKKKKLQKMFSPFGEIESVRFRCAASPDTKTTKKVAVIKRTFHSDRTSLVCYIRFKDEESAKRALEMNGTVIESHHIRVDLATSRHQWVPKKAVFVGNLPFTVEDDDLWSFFRRCGKIEWVRVVRDNKTAMGLGYGFVNFGDSESVQNAVALNGKDLKDRSLVIERYAKKPKKKLAVIIDSDKKTYRRGKKEFSLREREGKKVWFKKVNEKKKGKEFAGRMEEKKKKKQKKKFRLGKDDKRKKRLIEILSK